MEIDLFAYTKVSWKEYLIPEQNPNIIRFLKTHAKSVYKQIIKDIKLALDSKRDEVLLVVHKNSIHVVSIERKEFDDVLEYILQWFLKIEEYEECAAIRDLKIRINEN